MGFICISTTGVLARGAGELKDKDLIPAYGYNTHSHGTGWYRYAAGVGWEQTGTESVPEETRGYMLLMTGAI